MGESETASGRNDPPPAKDPAIQLRALRWVLGRDFKAITSEQLADLINIPPVAIRAIENRRRKFNDDDRLNIEMLLGATWDEESNQWVAIADRMPYTREKYEFHQSHGARGPDPEQARAEYHRMVDLYLDRLVPEEHLLVPAKLNLALTKLYRELRRIAAQDNISLGALQPEKRSQQKKRSAA